MCELLQLSDLLAVYGVVFLGNWSMVPLKSPGQWIKL